MKKTLSAWSAIALVVAGTGIGLREYELRATPRHGTTVQDTAYIAPAKPEPVIVAHAPKPVAIDKPADKAAAKAASKPQPDQPAAPPSRS